MTSDSAKRIFGGVRVERPRRAAPPPSPHRRALIAKVHLVAKEIGLSEDDYRGVLMDVAGKRSAADCTDAELAAVLDRFRPRGCKPAAPRGRGGARAADHAAAAKARALWISLHHLNAIADPSERALEAFARRQLKCARLQWADQALAYKLIEALKAIADRHGWSQDLAGVRPGAVPVVLRRRLVDAILGKLAAAGIVPGDWDAGRAAFELGGVRIAPLIATASELDTAARVLGDALREATR